MYVIGFLITQASGAEAIFEEKDINSPILEALIVLSRTKSMKIIARII